MNTPAATTSFFRYDFPLQEDLLLSREFFLLFVSSLSLAFFPLIGLLMTPLSYSFSVLAFFIWIDWHNIV